MFTQNLLALALLLVPGAFAAPIPNPKPLAPLNRAPHAHRALKENSYIVSIKPNTVDPENRLQWLTNVLNESGLDIADEVDTESLKAGWDASLFNGLGGVMSESAVEALRAQDEVAWIQEDITMHTTALVQQRNAPWGISRISSANTLQGSDPLSLGVSYTFDDSAGTNTDVYIIDTGVRTSHQDFGGRASFLGTFSGGQPNTDVNGHGTHVAGSAAGSVFGVAKQAKIFAVKVMEDDGSGATSNIISGIIAAANNALNNPDRPAVLSMSLGGPVNQAIDDVVSQVVNSGIPVIVAAGNETQDANNVSPARLADAITVGSSDINDVISGFSNFGNKVDIFGPGTDILSCGVDADDAIANLSGTSMATPHISGLSLLIMGQEGKLTPADLKARLVELGRDGVVKNVPGGTISEFAGNGANA